MVRVELDRELKREYQRFLQARNEGDRDSSGRPDRTPQEIEGVGPRARPAVASTSRCISPMYPSNTKTRTARSATSIWKLTTEHYRGAHGAAVARSGFTIHGSGGGSRSGGRPFDPRAADEFP